MILNSFNKVQFFIWNLKPTSKFFDEELSFPLFYPQQYPAALKCFGADIFTFLLINSQLLTLAGPALFYQFKNILFYKNISCNFWLQARYLLNGIIAHFLTCNL